MGDVWGSIALADECRKHSDEILFVISEGDEANAAIRGRGYQLQTAESVLAEQNVLRAFRPDVILVNKLNNDPAHIKALKELADLVVTVDDAGDGARWADLKFNVLYHVPGALTDPQYITLRDEFKAMHGREKAIRPQVQELLILQGGSDTHGFTPRIIQALEQMALRPHCTVVVGPAFTHHAELKAAVDAFSLNLSIVKNAGNMAELMWKADLAITAAGLTMFELACMGTPNLVVCAEPFEVETAARLHKAGAVINLGFGGDLDYTRVSKTVNALAADAATRRRMSDYGKQLVDGRGCERIVKLVRERAKELSGSRS